MASLPWLHKSPSVIADMAEKDGQPAMAAQKPIRESRPRDGLRRMVSLPWLHTSPSVIADVAEKDGYPARKPICDSRRVAEKDGQPVVAAQSPTVIARFAHGVLRRLASGALTQFACECLFTRTVHDAYFVCCVVVVVVLSLFRWDARAGSPQIEREESTTQHCFIFQRVR